MWTDEQILAMDTYLWLDFSIEMLWRDYCILFDGETETTEEEELHIMIMMEKVYDLETKIIDLVDSSNITFAMIDRYKEINNVRGWPTRFC